MKRTAIQNAEYFAARRRRRTRWRRMLACLAAAVALSTVLLLMRPAVTLESPQCGLEEHTHGASCYTQVTQVERRVLICGYDDESPPDEAPEESEITEEPPGEPTEEPVEDAAEEPIEEPPVEEPTEEPPVEEPVEEPTEEPPVDEPIEEPPVDEPIEEPAAEEPVEEPIEEEPAEAPHVHTDACYATVTVPLDTTALTCPLAEDETHTHSFLCYGTWELTCPLSEHTHTDACRTGLSEEEQAQVDALIDMIDALPADEALDDALDALADDPEALEAWYAALLQQVQETLDAYDALTPALQAAVTNAERLTELRALCSAEPLAASSILTVYQINKYSEAETTLVYGGSVQDKLGSGMSFTYWDVIVVEKSTAGQLYVSQYVTADGDKRSYKATTSDGFVLLLYNTLADATVGSIVSVGFDYKSASGTSTSGYGTVSFSSASSTGKAEKDNTGKLSINKDSADTSKLIEVNLYDYGSNINTLWNSDKKYPGYQQDKGQLSVSKTYHSNFGNNITEDLAAENSSVTNQGGAINTTADGANSPISNAMKTTLGEDGYPALADGTSLSYLFSNSDYATKQNENSINGLFLYDDTTGAYTFNSRKNHAQFNAENDTFTLYDQIISSNAFWYPFGNFLPFNDIVHQSAQASTIDGDYLRTIVASAQKKYADGKGDEYNTLATVLNTWIGLMDGAYSDGWGAAQAMNEYFNSTSGPSGKLNNSKFDFADETDLLNDLYSIDFDEATDFYFGMEMKMNFMQPKGGLTGKDGQQPMVFYFTGDDDVWVYIDGVLFLDLSGIHRHVGGEIDFVNGVVKYYSLDISTGDVSEVPYKTVPFSELVDSSQLNEAGTFQDYSTHSFNFYYMERGAGSGVCRMNFNFPLLKKNSISVTKELEANTPLLGNPDFKFQVLKEGGSDLFIGADVKYDIQDATGNSLGSGTTDANGVFTLKAGQTAVFNGIDEDSGKYFVRELLDKSFADQYGTVYVNGSTVTKNEQEVTVGSSTFTGVDSPIKDVSDGSTMFRFVNHVDTGKLGSLSVTKKVTGYEGEGAEKYNAFTFEIKLDGTLLPVDTKYTIDDIEYTVSEAGKITLSRDQTATISGILAGSTFTVKEIDDSGLYTPSYTVNDKSQNADKASRTVGTAPNLVAVTVTNRATNYELPQTGGTGTLVYTAVGLLLCAAALGLYSGKKRRREAAP